MFLCFIRGYFRTQQIQLFRIYSQTRVGKIWQSEGISISLWGSSGGSWVGWGALPQGLEMLFLSKIHGRKISGFEDANLCRKCRLCVEHFVSSRKKEKQLPKKPNAECLFFSLEIFIDFPKGWGGNGRFPHPRPRYLGWVWGHLSAQGLSLQLLSGGNIDGLG